MMEKEIQRKKKVLIDLTNYGSLTAGFGQIAANYAAAFSSMPVEDLHFVYLLRQKYMQEFGPNVRGEKRNVSICGRPEND